VKTQNKGYYAVQGHRGRYQSKACMRLAIMINSINWQPFSYRCGVIAGIVQILDTAYLSHPWGGGLGQRTMFILGSL